MSGIPGEDIAIVPVDEPQVPSNPEHTHQVVQNPEYERSPSPQELGDMNPSPNAAPTPDEHRMQENPHQDQYDVHPREMHHGIGQNGSPNHAPAVTMDSVFVNSSPTMQDENETGVPTARHKVEPPVTHADDSQNEIEMKSDMYPESAIDLSNNSATFPSNAKEADELCLSTNSKTELADISTADSKMESIDSRATDNEIESMDSRPVDSEMETVESAPMDSKPVVVEMSGLDGDTGPSKIDTVKIDASAESVVPSQESDENVVNKVEVDSAVESRPQSLGTSKAEVVPTPQDQGGNPLDFVTVSFYQFKCKFCTASFDRRKTFKKHLTNEHGILPYVCNLCGIGYDHKSDLKDHVKAHRKESAAVNNEPSDQVDVPEYDGSDATEKQGYHITQVEQTKLHLTKSLNLLAQVSHMRDTRESRKAATSSASGKSSSPAVVKAELNASGALTVPNKRKRGRPRRLPGTQPTTNKRKAKQPRKIKATVKKEPAVRKEHVRKPRKKTKKQQKLEEEAAAAACVVKMTPIKIEVKKGNYKLRPQSIDLDYSSQLQPNTEHLPFACRFCKMEFKTKAKKLSHEKLHKEFKCNTCGSMFKTFKEMKKHEDKHFPDEMKCHFCNQLFKLKKTLWEHEETHGEPVVCRWCSAKFGKRQDLDAHERLHFISKTSNTIFECHFCHKICRSRKAWKSHLVSHSNIRAYECDICGKKYKQQGSYKLHMQRHNNTFYKFTCQYCGKKYGQKALLIIHERTHTNERPFKCTHCDLAYPSKNQLDHHMQRVLGVKHMCSFCGKQLNSKSSLEIHERIHTGNRPIKCKFCEQDFIEASSYKYHLRVIHTGERFVCKYCGKQCKARGVLNAHMRVHTGERPFKCKYCSKAFRSGNVLRTHLQGIHLGVRHKCEMCGREFAQTSALNTHKKLVHQGLKWKDIQLQRKINREERERYDRELIENAVGKPSSIFEGEPQLHGNAKYPERLVSSKTAPPPAEDLPTSAEAALKAIERSMASSVVPETTPPVIAPPTQVPQVVPHTQAPSLLAHAQAQAASMVAHAAAMLPPAARPIVEPDRANVDVIFPPNAMYHVL